MSAKAETYIATELEAGDMTAADIAQVALAYQRMKGLEPDGMPGDRTIASAVAYNEYFDRVVAEKLAQDAVDAEESKPYRYLPNLSLSPESWLEGIDVSHYQSFTGKGLDDSKLNFSFVKATEGTEGKGTQDPAMEDHINRLRNCGVVGLYHFARPSSAATGIGGDPNLEAENFVRRWEKVRSAGVSLLPPVLDIEDDRVGTPAGTGLVEWCLKWCKRCELLTGRTPIVYSYHHYIKNMFPGAAYALNEYPLWLARYPTSVDRDEPPEILGWPWLFWQWTNGGHVDGISGDCDRNFFRGTATQLLDLVK